MLIWSQLFINHGEESDKMRDLSIDLLQCKYKNIKLNKKLLIGLLTIFVLMFLSWSIIPQQIIPPEIIAVIGCIFGMFYSSLCGVKINTLVDFKTVLTIASFLFLGNIIGHSGILTNLANYFQQIVSNPMLLLILIMILTSIISGLFGAGPAASAMMPVVIYLCNTTFQKQSDWVAIAYAASICAGSSMFMWSATAGFILSKNVNNNNLTDSKNKKLTWNIYNYLKYGIQNYIIQMLLSILFIYLVIE